MKSFTDIVQYRRAIRKYDQNFEFDPEVVTRALELSTLAPNSSNMQMWEIHRVRSPEMLKKAKVFCMEQNAAKTANELIIFATAPQKWKQRAEMNANVIRRAFAAKPNTPEHVFAYYEKDMPLLYSGEGLVEYKGVVGEQGNRLRKEDVRVILNKSVALAAMTFMYALSEAGYDSCPMEGFEEDQIKKLLGLPQEADVCMIVSCGKRLPEGVYGPRLRLDAKDVIKEH
ncbi:nitroreductase family protein [Serratia sp. DD3]|uniref:nitroreductase family protein n=1 Tax=Serratia sp. DD3 TaxID=1410619 RepID=UPI0004D34FBD|nr:nitroreductase family protein [Serratia sp. DD3]KEY60401.1 putative NAD(P)H nitroreductase YfkO [Serratia sp. DD3]